MTVRGKDIIVPGTNEASKKQPIRRDARKAERAKAKGNLEEIGDQPTR